MTVEPGQQCDHPLVAIGRHRICRDCAAVYAAVAGPSELTLLGQYAAVRALLEEYTALTTCPDGEHICANHPIHAQAKIIRQRMDIERLTAQLRIATDQLQAFSDQGQERYPGEMGTFAMDALIQMSVVE